jgi:hypothetical protein
MNPEPSKHEMQMEINRLTALRDEDSLRIYDLHNEVKALAIGCEMLKIIANKHRDKYLASVERNARNESAMWQAAESMDALFGIPKELTGEGAGGVAVWREGGSASIEAAIALLRGRLK